MRNSFFGNGLDLFDKNVGREDLMKTDIYEKDGIYYLEMDLPGFSKENIVIDYDNGYITIGATHEESKEDKGEYLHREKFYGEYKRSFYIGEVVEEEIKAQYHDGILHVTLPKKTEEMTNKRQITID